MKDSKLRGGDLPRVRSIAGRRGYMRVKEPGEFVTCRRTEQTITFAAPMKAQNLAELPYSRELCSNDLGNIQGHRLLTCTYSSDPRMDYMVLSDKPLTSSDVKRLPADAIYKMKNTRQLSQDNAVSGNSAEAITTDPTETYVRLNIGGKSYCVRKELYTEERTLMHDIVESSHEERLRMVDGCDPRTGEYYLERNSRLADHIVDFFATGSLHRPQNMCVEKFKEELAFWRISHDQMASCCTLARCAPTAKPPLQAASTFDEFETDFDGACMQSFRLSTWRFLEDPQSSVPAAVFAILSVVFVFGSVFGLILGSMPEFQEDPSNASAYHAMHAKTSEAEKLHKFLPSVTKNDDFPDFVYKPTDSPNFALVLLEYVCIGWFTFEYIIRLIIYPKRGEFLRKTLNIIDMLTILPFYLELCLPFAGVESHFKEITGAMLVVRVLRVLKMARVFKLARYSSSLQTFGQTLKSSITELSMLSMFLLTGIVFFSTIMYYLEKDEPHSDFYSIPAACWWCVVTMATVGYGDAKPVTVCELEL
ncbi:K+ channel tetramerization domain protein [Teladorsagia circumcincta]|uniref:K+ channel tetramerization domain protein n=1 Tax=Teladorsagia circumcincta TaxID=45464 RepID=A0A2G9V084_TELCI|nr:K+ channel tetramerization domain protein [Teladorsagia circumcincta]